VLADAGAPPADASWFRRHARQGWATTAFTRAAFVRVVSQQVFAGRAIAIGEVAELLWCNTGHPKHRLVPLDFGFAEVMAVCTGGMRGDRQITDAWLLTADRRAGAVLPPVPQRDTP
jgi:uncharacterized protein